jgi:hypothetical protein
MIHLGLRPPDDGRLGQEHEIERLGALDVQPTEAFPQETLRAVAVGRGPQPAAGRQAQPVAGRAAAVGHEHEERPFDPKPTPEDPPKIRRRLEPGGRPKLPPPPSVHRRPELRR